MGNCNSTFNCTACFDGGCNYPINADADIVGPGVLASFLLSALITIASIIYGYFSDCLPQWYLNEVDEAVLIRYKASWFSTRLVPFLERLYIRLAHFIRPIFRRSGKPYSNPIDPDKRIKALARFVLAMSDQQLVTGLAILIGALSSRCILSLYELSVVVSLAWFSTTTHLATLDVLRDYFIQHQVVRDIRMIGMVSMMGILSFAIFATGKVYGIATDIPSYCVLQYSSSSVSGFDLLASMLLGLYLLCSYLDRIGHLFNSPDETTHSLHPNQEQVLRVAIFVSQPKLKIKTAEYNKIISDAIAAKTNADREAMRSRAANKLAPSSIAFYKLCLKRYSDSFLAGIPTLIFGLSYGISQVIVNRWSNAPKLSEDVNVTSFGQIVPLFLLALPLLAAAEVYYDAKKSSSTASSSNRKTQFAQTNTQTNLPSKMPNTQLTSKSYLPHPIDQITKKGQTDEVDENFESVRDRFLERHNTGMGICSSAGARSAWLHNTDSSQSEILRLATEGTDQSQSCKSSRQLLESIEPIKSMNFIVMIFFFCCLYAIVTGILPSIGTNTTTTIGTFIMSVFFTASIASALSGAASAFKLARQKILEYQGNKAQKDSHDKILRHDEELSLQEVIVSPSPSRSGTIYYMHGALDNNDNEETAQTMPTYSTPSAPEDAAQTADVGVHQEMEILHDRHQNDSSVKRQLKSPAQKLPQRQVTALSTGAEAQGSLSSAHKTPRRVNTK